MQNSFLSRRTVVKAGSAAGLTAILAAAGASAASAASPLGSSPASGEHHVIDLGPAVVQFSLMSAKRVGNILYIGSRNLEPARIVALDLGSGLIVGETELSNGDTVQALDVNDAGTILYAGINQKAKGPQPNLFKWELADLGQAASPIGTMGDRDVRDMSVAPDGHVFAVGGGSGTPPALWEYDPELGTVVSRGIPDTGATQARAVAATDSTVYFGAGSSLAGSADTSRACLYAYDRATGEHTLITPSEMEADPSIRDLEVFGNQLLIGSSSSLEPAKVAAMDLGDPGSYQIAVSLGTTAKKFARIGDVVYFANDDGLCQYNLSSNTVSRLEFEGAELGGIWGVDAHNNSILATSAFGFVATIDPVAGTNSTTDLGEAGARADAQKVMGLAAGGGYIYAGGNGTIARHSVHGAPTAYLRAPGEAKDALMVGSTLYTGQYSGEGIWMYNPDDGQPIRQAAAFPKEQNRPLDVDWDLTNQLVLVGSQSDTEGGGSLWTYDPATGEARWFSNPIDAVQLIRGVASRDGIAYLGGGGPALPDGGTIVAFDPLKGEELWRIDPQGSGTAAMAMEGRNLYALSRQGLITVVDVVTRKVIHQADVSALSHGFGAMINNNGVVYGASYTNVFRFDPATFAVETVLADTEGGWYSGSHLTSDESGNIYTLQGRNLVRLEVPARPQVAVEVSARSIGGSIMLQVRAVNAESVPVEVSLSTPYGKKHFNNVQPGKNAFHAFSVRSATLPAGEITIQSSAVIGGLPVSSTRTVRYISFK
ncbi:hypothetical protein ART_0869 [Arthrobacter sp. PAMC 25486]|uniref:outer membrane protein assembly factor BamB family protein n=1 Tax=Arthrobacter sp. PAMC 25486 TaxID=1494608 RepID=UPI000535CA4B|nr:PQQ-binding-like beta-propeller repeat protein [Arthrobacter sp. PAMC 25486]AIY00468.1 hypothetical protein ART_0869 [Arthrobacter sp. PAMC 25486]